MDVEFEQLKHSVSCMACDLAVIKSNYVTRAEFEQFKADTQGQVRTLTVRLDKQEERMARLEGHMVRLEDRMARLEAQLVALQQQLNNWMFALLGVQVALFGLMRWA